MKNYDYLVIGSGIAGLTIALKAAKKHSVAILTKTDSLDCSTNYAQGGIASVMLPEDSFEKHIDDTLSAGAGLCNRKRVAILTQEGPAAIQNLIDWGVSFTKNEPHSKQGSPYHLALEGGHTERRILHANDLTGQEIMRAMIDKVCNNPNIDLFENHTAIDLVTDGSDKSKQCVGVTVLNTQTMRYKNIAARATFIATGGAAQIFKHSTNPNVSTGDGIAMAFRAGCTSEDMEFMQFHPTTLYNPGEKTFLISEAVRGHGGILKNHLGEPFMKGVHPLESLAPRNVVARAIDREMKKHHSPHVYLDITHKKESNLKKHFPNIFKHCLNAGINMSKDWIPVVPAAHYICGGIKANHNAQTNLNGLYVCGESGCFETHGANRLASNSLLESVVFSLRAFKYSANNLNNPFCTVALPPKKRFIPSTQDYDFLKKQVQSIMWDKVGIIRTTNNLKKALELVQTIRKKADEDYQSPVRTPLNLIELRNVALCAELTIRSALKRKESRGLHISDDYTFTKDDSTARHTFIQPSLLYKS
ncbi:MAG: L-aspartate oxidase [Fibrobacterales bacterium]